MQTEEYNVADELAKLYEIERARFKKLWEGTMEIIRDPEVPSRHKERLLALLERVHGKKS